MIRRRENAVMRAWLLDSYDGIDTLRLGKVPDPRPSSGDVLVNVRFAALNRADAFLALAM
jgi:NADPH:quinone reductase-like Zn-dependent oxidoreductase